MNEMGFVDWMLAGIAAFIGVMAAEAALALLVVVAVVLAFVGWIGGAILLDRWRRYRRSGRRR